MNREGSKKDIFQVFPNTTFSAQVLLDGYLSIATEKFFSAMCERVVVADQRGPKAY